MPIGTTGLNFGSSFTYETYFVLDPVNALECRIKNSMVTITASPTAANQDCSGCYYNGLIYYGFGTNGATYISTFFSYNPLSNTWTTLTGNSVGLQQPGLVEANGKIYAIGGELTGGATASNTVYEYNIDTNAWAAKATAMPASVERAGCVSFRNTIYMLGGLDPSTNTTDKNLYSYNPVTDKWKTLSAFPNANGISDCKPVIYGNYLYACGGVNTVNGTLSSVYRYDLFGNTWLQLGNLPTPNQDANIVILNNKIYLYGGNNAQVETAVARYYDIANDKWITDISNSSPTLFGCNQGVAGRMPVGLGGA